MAPANLRDGEHSDGALILFNGLFGLVLGHAVTLLDLASQIFRVAFGNIEIIVGQLAPLLLDAALELLPLALDSIFVHGLILLLE